MREVLNSSQMKACDTYTIEQIKIPSLVLMERAALAVVKEILNDYLPDEITAVVFAGTGNNGGDGIAIGRILKEYGAKVEILTLGNLEKCSAEMKQQLSIAKNIGMQIKKYDDSINSEYNVIVDAIFGIGLSREVKGIFQSAIEWINRQHSLEKKASVYAVDIPSGIHADTGERLLSAVYADKTITFQYGKLGLYLAEGRVHSGKVIIKNIGISAEPIDQGKIRPEVFFYETEDIKRLPPRAENGHKGTFGKVLVIAGSKNMAGAAVFAAESAYRTGCGLVEVFTVEENRIIVQEKVPEAVLTTYENIADSLEKLQHSLKSADVIVLGPGLSTSQQAEHLVEYTLKNAMQPCVVDADAINILAKHPQWLTSRKAPSVLTPHVKELARLSNKDICDIKKAPIASAKEIATYYNCVVAAKDARTIVAAKQPHMCYLNLSGCHGMATGGSGDVLTGIIAGLIAQKMPLFEAACLGVYIHGLAGEATQKKLGGYSMTASDLIKNIYNIIR